MLISLLFNGPIGAVYTCVIGCSIIFLRGNVYGGVLKLIAELATILAFAAIRKGIITKSVAAVISRVLVMTVANFYLLQLFYGAPEPYVVGLLLPLAAFNTTQALINIIPAYIIYSRLGNRGRLHMQETKIIDNISHFLTFSHKRQHLPDRRRNLDNGIHPVSSHPIIS